MLSHLAQLLRKQIQNQILTSTLAHSIIKLNIASTLIYLHSIKCYAIVGDPGAVSRVDKMFETSPWALTLTEPVPEVFELPASDWPEKDIFLANQRRGAAG